MAITYKLLTPGPLTTTDTVKREMLFDHCTWDDDYKHITQRIRRGLVKLAEADETEYTAVLMQGSGTFGVESVLTSSVGPDDKVLICSNGAYGARMVEIAKHAGLNFVHYVERYDRSPAPARVAEYLREDPAITHVAMVHSETTSGILNDIEGVAHIVKKAGKTMIVDAMSSFGGVPMCLPEIGADFLVSSANKCIQGVPGFSFILARRTALEPVQGSGTFAFPRPLRPVGRTGEGRQMALYFPHPRRAGLRQSDGGAGRGRRRRGAARALCGK